MEARKSIHQSRKSISYAACGDLDQSFLDVKAPFINKLSKILANNQCSVETKRKIRIYKKKLTFSKRTLRLI